MTDLMIGRESGTANPRLAVEQNGKTMYWGKPGTVPMSVSRKHCHVVIGDEGKVEIEDITENNFMYVNGQDCKKKGNLAISDKIELGPDRYPLELEGILKALSSQKEYDISHLQAIYDAYQKERFDMQVRERKFNALSTLPGVLSMASLGLAFFIEKARVVMIVIAAVLGLVFALIRLRNADKIPSKMKALEDSFRERYVCPNPSCGRFLGVLPYKELLKNKSCPYCKAKFTEE